jgi:hypothetical protein
MRTPAASQTEDVSPGQGVAEGVNVWITLSPINASIGGGLALANGSASAPWREECRKAITGTDKKGIPQTCNMKTITPACHRRMEERMLVFNMEPGDAIVHSRYTFHRAVPFQEGERKVRAESISTPLPLSIAPSHISSRTQRGARFQPFVVFWGHTQRSTAIHMALTCVRSKKSTRREISKKHKA